MKKNKYEDIKMIDLYNKVEDILDIYINRLYSTDKTVGVVVNKEIAEYFLDVLRMVDDISIKEIDLIDYSDINEYLVSVDNDGYLTCVPIEQFVVMDKTDILYIDMDGDIKQNIIDYCVDEDKEVILFGQEYDDCDGDCENCVCNKSDEDYVNVSKDEDGNQHGFTVSKSDGDSYMSYSFYTTEDLSENDIHKMLKAFGF